MRTLVNRSKSFLVVTGFVAASIVAAACSSDSTSPTATVGSTVGTAPNGTTISIDSILDNQSAVAGTPVQITVHVRTAAGAGIAGDTVRWNVATGKGTVPSPTSVTDASGTAAVAWTLGKVAGPNTLGANISGAAISISATGTVGPLAAFTKVSPDSQAVTGGGSVLLTVTAADASGNAIAGIPVRWMTTGGTVAPDSSVSGSSGNNQAVFTTPPGVGRFTVTATATGFPPLTFLITTF